MTDPYTDLRRYARLSANDKPDSLPARLAALLADYDAAVADVERLKQHSGDR